MYDICVGVFQKREILLNPQPSKKMPCCEESFPALSLHLQSEAELMSGLVQFCPVQVR